MLNIWDLLLPRSDQSDRFGYWVLWLMIDAIIFFWVSASPPVKKSRAFRKFAMPIYIFYLQLCKKKRRIYCRKYADSGCLIFFRTRRVPCIISSWDVKMMDELQKLFVWKTNEKRKKTHHHVEKRQYWFSGCILFKFKTNSPLNLINSWKWVMMWYHLGMSAVKFVVGRHPAAAKKKKKRKTAYEEGAWWLITAMPAIHPLSFYPKRDF